MNSTTTEVEVAEQWRYVPIPGYTRYRVSDQGRVAGIRGGILKQIENEDNYWRVQLHDGRKRSRCMYVHRLVYLAFAGELPDKWEIHHDDRNRSNNAFDNLVACERNEDHWMHHRARPEPGLEGNGAT